ncbi:glucosamine-6-phosphate deaminase [Spiroplasma endosymbiont of Crioceris asparagi]|uniref:glucosamine-6-phosphate deaminase n=1 Tax=Spiroplasma endosymbiont of Crioceris asparagi TaxID=3066286 RepID=UPI0030D5FE35
MKVIVVKNAQEAGKVGAEIILNLVKENSKTVLGLATGSTPIPLYKEIISRTNSEKIDWSNVTTFNLDEYKGLTEKDDQSYVYFMRKQLFNHINIEKENTHLPSGLINSNHEAVKYDEKIKNHGGIDLQLLGLGINGHVGFNEPGTPFNSLTSIVNLTESTIEANARFFEKKSDVPTQAISMGLQSIMNAKKILLVATGKNKAEAVHYLINGPISEEWPCTVLLNHKDVTVIVDEEANSYKK